MVNDVYDALKAEFARRGCYFLKEGEELDRVRKTLIVNGAVNRKVVGQPADAIAAEAKSQVETLEARYESLKAAAAAYKEEFSRLLDTQANALRESNGLF